MKQGYKRTIIIALAATGLSACSPVATKSNSSPSVGSESSQLSALNNAAFDGITVQFLNVDQALYEGGGCSGGSGCTPPPSEADITGGGEITVPTPNAANITGVNLAVSFDLSVDGATNCLAVSQQAQTDGRQLLIIGSATVQVPNSAPPGTPVPVETARITFTSITSCTELQATATDPVQGPVIGGPGQSTPPSLP